MEVLDIVDGELKGEGVVCSVCVGCKADERAVGGEASSFHARLIYPSLKSGHPPADSCRKAE